MFSSHECDGVLLMPRPVPQRKICQGNYTSKDQINAVSEFTLNMLKKKIPLSPPTVAKLKKYRVMLRELGKRRNSLRKRRQLLVNQTGGSFWSGMNDAFCQCFKRS